MTAAHLRTLIIGAAGAAVFYFLDLPLPLLIGPMLACLVAALAGVPLQGIGVVSVGMRTVVGVAVGASITPAVVGRLDEFVISAVLVPAFVVVIALAGYPYFRRVWGFDRTTAFYAAMPGGLQEMIAFGQDAGANPRALSLVHATRILVIAASMPFIITGIFDVSLDNPPGPPALDVPALELVVMVACALVGWLGGQRIGLFGAAILGPLALTAVASLTGLIHNRPPAEAIYVAQFFIGISVGVHYVRITAAELRRVVLAALGYCAILAVISSVFAGLLVMTGVVPQLEAMLAFAPGGQAELTVLAIAAGADLAYVVSVHLLRVVIVILLAPIAARLARVATGAESRR